MGADFSIKPVGAPVATPFIKPAPEAARDAVPTELPPSQSVTASQSSLAANLAPGYIPLDDVSHDIVIDRAAAAVVYHVVDKRTNQVVEQFPDAVAAARARLSAFARCGEAAKGADET